MNSKRVIALGMAIFMTAASMTGCGKNQIPAQSATVSETTKNETKTPTTNVDYSEGLTDDGFYEGVSAKDYVTLPEDYKALPADFVDYEIGTVPKQNETAQLCNNLHRPVFDGMISKNCRASVCLPGFCHLPMPFSLCVAKVWYAC